MSWVEHGEGDEMATEQRGFSTGEPSLESTLGASIEAGEVLPLLTQAQSGYALFTLDAKGRIDSWTPGAETIFGWTAREVLGSSFERTFTSEDVAAGAPRQELSQARREGYAPDVRWHRRKGDGRVFISGTTQRLLDKDGKVSGYLKAGRDLTGQYEAEAALKQAEQKQLLILENVRDYALYSLDPEGRVNSWNIGLQRLTGYSEEEILNRHFGVLYLASDQNAGRPQADLARARADGRVETEGWRVRKDGSPRWVHEILTSVLQPGVGPRGFVAIARDITPQRLAERERLERERETAQLAERTRMAQELHDTLAQGFTGIRLQMELAAESLRQDPPSVDVALGHVGRAVEFALHCQQDSRRSIRALRSTLFEDLYLDEALEQLVRQLQGSVPISWHSNGPPLRLPAQMQKDVYRIAQEALNNALRHSGASHIVLWLERSRNQARLLIRDDGRGFRSEIEGTGFGLLGMRERTERLGGRLEIDSDPQAGTQVSLTWDLPAHSSP